LNFPSHYRATIFHCALPHIAHIEHSSKEQLCFKVCFRSDFLGRWDAAKMQDEKKERWRELCEKVSTEQDPKKLQALIAELSRALEERQERLTGK
jgi:hypothetical protein